MKFKPGLFLLAFFSSQFVQAQIQQSTRSGEFYFSWGYNTEWFTNCNVHISQAALGNEYTFEDVNGHDKPGWDNHFFQKPMTIPQYNYRIGYFFNEKKNLAIELNFDHTKYIIEDNQAIRIRGKLNNKGIDSTILFSESQGFYYYLNNGANFFLFNIVKRFHWVSNKKETVKIDALVKLGIGPVWPHVKNSLFGNENSPDFQFGGWNTGCEATLRATFFKYVYLEYANKLDYARYSKLRIYEGTAKQAFATYEMIFNLGLTFPVGKKIAENPKN